MTKPESMSSAEYRERVLGEKPKAKPRADGSAAVARAAAMCDVFAETLRTLTACVVVREWEFDADRRWRFDVALPHLKIAFELDGGYRTGGHKRGDAYEDEARKWNAAARGGWRVYRIPNRWIKTGEADAVARSALGWEPA